MIYHQELKGENKLGSNHELFLLDINIYLNYGENDEKLVGHLDEISLVNFPAYQKSIKQKIFKFIKDKFKKLIKD
jgi:hypothetical protein